MNTPKMGWSKSVPLAIVWFVAGFFVLYPLLLTQAKILLKNDWLVPGLSTVELVQTEFFAFMAILGLILGWHYRSWKIVSLLSAFAIAGAFVLGGLLFAIDSPFVGM